MTLPDNMLAKWLAPEFATDAYDSGPWQNGGQGMACRCPVLYNHPVTWTGNQGLPVASDNASKMAPGNTSRTPSRRPANSISSLCDGHQSCGQHPAVLWRTLRSRERLIRRTPRSSARSKARGPCPPSLPMLVSLIRRAAMRRPEPSLRRLAAIQDLASTLAMRRSKRLQSGRK